MEYEDMCLGLIIPVLRMFGKGHFESPQLGRFQVKLKTHLCLKFKHTHT